MTEKHEKAAAYRVTRKPSWHDGKYYRVGDVVRPPATFEQKKKDGTVETVQFKPSKNWEPIDEAETKASKTEKAEAPKPAAAPAHHAPKRHSDKDL